METSEVNPRNQLRAWVREQLEGKPELRAPEVAELALETFGTQTDVLVAFARQMLPTEVYRLVLEVISHTRNGEAAIVPTEDTDTTEAREARLARVRQRYAEWLEHAGDRHVQLLEMTAADIDLAIAERQKRVDDELHKIAFLSALRKRLKGGQRVRDKLTIEQIDFIEQALKHGRKAA